MGLATSYRSWFLLIVIACILIPACVVQFAWRSKKIVFDIDLYDQIQNGMTREEVVSTLGMPPGDYSTGFVVPESGRTGYNAFDWISDEGRIRVWFDKDDKVEDSNFRLVTIWKLTWYDRIRIRLGL
jgi:hypothetical protein